MYNIQSNTKKDLDLNITKGVNSALSGLLASGQNMAVFCDLQYCENISSINNTSMRNSLSSWHRFNRSNFPEMSERSSRLPDWTASLALRWYSRCNLPFFSQTTRVTQRDVKTELALSGWTCYDIRNFLVFHYQRKIPKIMAILVNIFLSRAIWEIANGFWERSSVPRNQEFPHILFTIHKKYS